MTVFARLARNHRLSAILAIVLGAIVFVGVNTAVNSWFRTARIDLTENGLYTLSDGTKNILRNLREPITLRFFYSAETAKSFPTIHAYAERVRDLLQEYRAIAGGNIVIEEIDPLPFTEEEDRAAALGLQGAPTQNGENVYLGLSATNMADGQEAVPFFQTEREPFLEYDLTSIIYRLNQAKKPKLGIMTGLPLAQGSGGVMAQMQGQTQPFVAYAQLQQIFDLTPVDMDAKLIPADIDALILAQPKALSQETLYALDQFVMRGGRIIAFVDPMSEIAQLEAQQSGEAQPGMPFGSDLWLLKSWGVAYNPDEVVLDRARAQKVQYGQGARAVVDYPVWLGLSKDDDPELSDFDADDLVTSSLSVLNLASVGHLGQEQGATTTLTPLVRSSDDAMLFSAGQLALQADPDMLMSQFLKTGERYTIAARIAGPLKSAFPEGAPKSPPPKEGEAPPPALPAHIGETSGANIIVVADTDIFDDRFWVQVQNESLAVPIADNLAFIASAAENMLGSNDLISLRARATADRPFTVVENLRKEADVRFLREEQDLNARIAEVQEKLQALQSKTPEGADAATVTPEQQAELEKFRGELAETRGRLREVQRELRSGIDSLGNTLAGINIVLVPALLVIAAVIIAVLRRRRIAAAQQAWGRTG